MNATKQAFFLLISLAFLATSGWYFASSTPKSKLDAETLLTTTDTTMTHLRVLQFSTTGTLLHSLKSPLMKHIPQNNTHWIKNPEIVVIQENQPAWKINAQQATAIHGGEKITFKDEVKIHQQKGPHNEESTFTTEQVTYFPKTKHAITSKEVIFKQSANQVQSEGMKADLEKKQVKLLGKTRGIYDPNYG